MRLRLKEEPREWRKSALLGALGLSVTSTILRWRHVLSQSVWLGVLALLAFSALVAVIRPRAFRGWYRFSHRLGFVIVEIVGRIILGAFFFIFLTPVGLTLRLLGKDPLRLKRPPPGESCWVKCKESTPLDRMF